MNYIFLVTGLVLEKSKLDAWLLTVKNGQLYCPALYSYNLNTELAEKQR